MTDAPDAELLAEFARTDSQTAFTTLVERHIGLVHSVALRHTTQPQHVYECTAFRIGHALLAQPRSVTRLREPQ